MDELQKMGQAYLDEATKIQQRIVQLEKERDRYIQEKQYYLVDNLQQRILTLNDMYFEMTAIGHRFSS